MTQAELQNGFAIPGNTARWHRTFRTWPSWAMWNKSFDRKVSRSAPCISTKGLGLSMGHGRSIETVDLHSASGLASVYGVVVSLAPHHGHMQCGTQAKFLTTRNARACAGRSPSRPRKHKRNFLWSFCEKTPSMKHLCSLPPISHGIHRVLYCLQHILYGIVCILRQHNTSKKNICRGCWGRCK